MAWECLPGWGQPRPRSPEASDPVVPDVSSEEDKDLSSVASEVADSDPPSTPDPVPSSPPPVPSRRSASSSLSPDQIVLKRLICQSLPMSRDFILTWCSPEINCFVDGLLSQWSFSVSLRDFAVSYVSRLVLDYQKEYTAARKSKSPYVSVGSLLYEFLFWAGFDSTASLAGWCPPPVFGS